MTVTLRVPENYTWFFVNTDSESIDSIDRLLDNAMKYEDPDAQYTNAYKSGAWDGFVHIYSTDHSGAPMGLMGRARRLLESEGYDVETEVNGDRTGDRADVDWTGKYELRDYQNAAVKAVLENTGGIIHLPTGTGKTVTAMRLLYELTPIAGRSIVLVHTGELLYQWAEEVEETLGVEPGIIGDGNWSEGPVTIAMMQTLMADADTESGMRIDELAGDYGTAIFDECHRTSAAETMHEIGMNINAAYRVGLSATPWRNVQGEELKIEGAVGDVVYEFDVEDAIAQGHLAKPTFEIVDYGQSHMIGDYHEAYREYVSLSVDRNETVAEKCIELADRGYSTLVNVSRIAQGSLLEFMLNGDTTAEDIAGRMRDTDDEPEVVAQKVDAITEAEQLRDLGAVFLSGSDSTERRQDVMQRFEQGEIPVLISTILGEGVDIPDMNAIVLAHAGKSDIETIQVIGRALRPSGGDDAVIADVRDGGIFFEDAFTERQQTMAEYYGEYGPTGDYDTSTDRDPNEESRVDLTKPLSDEEEQEMLDWMTGDG